MATDEPQSPSRTEHLGSQPPASQIGGEALNQAPRAAAGTPPLSWAEQFPPRSNLTPGRPELLNQPLPKSTHDRDGGS
jgi:hypothetical protein